VGTGPLEDLINDHSDDLVDLVEQAARQSPEFAQLSKVWLLSREPSLRSPQID